MSGIGRLALLVAAAVGAQVVLLGVPVRGVTVAVEALVAVAAGQAVVGYLRQARAARGRERLGRALAALAIGAWAVSMARFALNGLVGRQLVPEQLTDAITGIIALLAAPVALLLCAPGIGAWAVRIRRFLDGAIIVGSLFFIAWHVRLAELVAAAEPGRVWLIVLMPTLELVTAALALVLLSRSVPTGAHSLSLLAVAMFAFAVATLIDLGNVAAGRPWYAAGAGFWYVLATLLLAVSSRTPYPAVTSIESEHSSTLGALLPHAPLAAAFALAATIAARTGTLGPVLTWLLLGTGGVVLIRQLLIIWTNQSLLRDLTSERERLAHQAFHDPLTGLANRSMFIDRARTALATAGPRTVTAVILVDLDGFKKVNDTLGHAAGDELLRAVGDRLRASVRESSLVARLGGDEFVVLLPELADDGEAEAAGARLLTALSAPLPVAGRPLIMRASAGVALAHGPGEPLDTLLRHADIALYKAKAEGKGRLCRFDPDADTREEERVRREIELRQALPKREFELYYQPIIDLDRNEIIGVEALLRWRHPRLGVLAPPAFLELAEAIGILPELGEWVLREACGQALRWQRLRPGLELNVNLSASQLADPGLVNRVRQVLAETGLAPGLLTLELTETVILTDVPGAATVLAELRALGLRIALDDFGTGYSSLSHLAQLPVDVLKIDKSFVQRMSGTEGGTLAEAVLQIARAFDLAPVAEGVEHAAQAEQLRALHCPQAQGYHFARPMPAADLTGMLDGADVRFVGARGTAGG